MIKEEKKMRIKIDILPNNTFLKDDGTFPSFIVNEIKKVCFPL